jgi:hypothetical protein
MRDALSLPGVVRGARPRPSLQAILTHPMAGLLISSSLALAVYGLAFTRPLFLPDWLAKTRLDITYLYQERPFAQVRLLASFLTLGALYLWGWWAARRARGGAAWVITVGGALACGLALLSMAPFDSADLYDNVMHGRILGVYAKNPFIQVGRDFPTDPFLPYMAWKLSPSAYGPAWELAAGLTARLAQVVASRSGGQLLANVVAFKLLAGAFWMGSIGLAAILLRRFKPRNALAGVYLLAWNPIVLYATWGNGHNEMAVVFWILLAAWLIFENRLTLAVLALVAGTLTKFIPVLLLPAVVAIAWRRLGSRRKRLNFLALTASLSLLMAALAYAPFWEGVRTLTIGRRLMLFSSSIPAVIYNLLKIYINPAQAARWVGGAAAGLTVAYALRRAWQIRDEPRPEQMALAGYDVLTFYLVATCLWLQPWYPIWLVGLAAVSPPGFRQRFAAFFSMAALSKQLVIGPILFWPRPKLAQPELEALFTLGVLGLPWLYLAAGHFSPNQPKSANIAEPAAQRNSEGLQAG